jgi:eukaryotic-like serine/threonine-protein kinase
MRLMQRAFIDDRYVVERLLGSGGMAEVYLAHDEVLDRQVALKILRDQYAEDEEFVERFRREARSAASLSHPNIVSIYDQGRSEDGAYYIAMEYVPQGTLKERIRQEGALTPGAAAGVALQIAYALQAAHEKGVIHRDIKPQNVLVTEKGDVKVTDFGIARAAPSTSSVATATGAVLGTVDYMSPEQARAEPVGPQSDLYSLGVVLYEMLTDTLPYEAESPIGAAIKHATEPVRSPREVNPRIPEPLAAMTTKLLSKDPADRYASAAALSDDLKRVRSSLSPVAADTQKTEITTVPLPPLPPGRGEQTNRTAVQPPPVAAPPKVLIGPRKRRGRLLTALFALLVVVILLGGLIWALARNADDLPSADDGQDSRMVRVPDLVDAETAESDLAAAGLRLGRRDEASSETVPVGVVAEQDPAGGTEAKEGTTVDIVVSTGPQQVPVDKKKQAQEDEKQRERQRQEEEKQREKQQQEKEKQREKQQQEEEKRREKGE